MQTQTQPQPAAAPTQAPTPPVTITVPGPGGTTQTLTIPTTSDEIAELFVQRAELSEQLSSVTSRRSELSSAIRSAPEGASRAGLEDRIRVLDQRILQIEADLAVVGRKLSSAPAELVSSTEVRNAGGDDFEEGVMAGGFSVLLLFPFALFYARRRWKRRLGVPPARISTESARLERVEQGIEAIAIEIERVSEGQRFLTKLLSESQVPLGASHRIPQPLAVKNEDPAKH